MKIAAIWYSWLGATPVSERELLNCPRIFRVIGTNTFKSKTDSNIFVQNIQLIIGNMNEKRLDKLCDKWLKQNFMVRKFNNRYCINTRLAKRFPNFNCFLEDTCLLWIRCPPKTIMDKGNGEQSI